MTTVAPSTVKLFDPSSLEKIAYDCVRTIPTKEPNDQYRLGYYVWNYLKDKKGTIADALRQSGARVLIPEVEAVAIIESELKKSTL